MATLILEKTIEILEEVVNFLQEQEDDYYNDQYEKAREDKYSRYGF